MPILHILERSGTNQGVELDRQIERVPTLRYRLHGDSSQTTLEAFIGIQ